MRSARTPDTVGRRGVAFIAMCLFAAFAVACGGSSPGSSEDSTDILDSDGISYADISDGQVDGPSDGDVSVGPGDSDSDGDVSDGPGDSDSDVSDGGIGTDTAPCDDTSDCGADEYCHFAMDDMCGDADDAEGVCRQIPTDCTTDEDPVCGCDGETYTNACEAAAAGVNVAAEGACEEEGCQASDECEEGEYCLFPIENICGLADSPRGECVVPPDDCTGDVLEVCGCDGETYSNGCAAASAGVNVSYTGACVEGACRANDECEAEEYCLFPENDVCGGGADPGECTARPDDCDDTDAPVCGCDGTDYLNACRAAESGMNVADEGICEVPPTICASADDCEAEEFCDFPAEDACGAGGAQGVCTDRPDTACADIAQTVCGCDGETYENPCQANVAGTDVAHEGTCGDPPTACADNDTCGADSFCRFPETDACGDTSEGTCEALPTDCVEDGPVVCGCDGNDYGSPCLAHQASVNVAAIGSCTEPPAACTSNDECEDVDYCHFATGCGVAEDSAGVCMERPESCTDEDAPVCGCDGQTYTNACEASAAGVSVDYEGACQDDLCADNGDCEADEYCRYFADDACGVDGGLGECIERPPACTGIDEPVCGCDGTTYGNACAAAQQGVDVAFTGRCEPDPVPCADSSDCARSEYCAYEDDNTCGENGDGVCTERPGGCERIFDPHCGCDGRTYTNACEAHAAGTDVASPGECPRASCMTDIECEGTNYCYHDSTVNTCGELNDRPGECRERTDCSPTLIQVCGCDLEQYDNQCAAAAEGVNVFLVGRCPAQPGPDGCTSNADCEDTEYCLFDRETNTCGEEEEGECVARPLICLAVAPVCGCDGGTWPSECEAARRGVNVASEGRCTDEPDGCRSSTDCPVREYCSFPDADPCGDDGTLGRCELRPAACLPGGIDDPVCGCNDITYSSECFAHSAGIDVREPGMCEGPPAGECRRNADCADSEFCDFPPEAECGQRNTGTCRTTPEICQPVVRRVCGCDGRTYSNACEANSSRVSVAASGTCGPGGPGLPGDPRE